MAFIKRDRVQELSITEGTGTIALSGVSGTTYRTFASVMSVGDTCQYLILSPNTGQWETGEGTYSATNTLTRTTVISPTANTAVDFGQGLKLVSMLPLASSTLVEDNQGNAEVSNDFRVHGDLTVDGVINGDVANPLQKAIGYARTESYVTANIVSLQSYPIDQCQQAFSNLGSDPFAGQAIGSAVVIVTATNHGQQTGATVSFDTAVTANGLTINANTAYSITRIDANSYSFTASAGTASVTSAFGGSGIVATYSTIMIRLYWVPEITPAQLVVRIDAGRHGTTMRAHPAQQESAWTVDQGPTPFTFILRSSVWVDDSVFVAGHCYVSGTTVDCAEELNDLFTWAQENGPTTIYLPPGGMYVQSSSLKIPGNCTLIGHGGASTFFFAASSDDQTTLFRHVITTNISVNGSNYPNVTNLRMSGFTVYGNRGYNQYRVGAHSIDLGGDTDTTVPLSKVTMTDIHVYGSPGYGMSFGGNNTKKELKVIDCSWGFSDSDGIDCKNRVPYESALLEVRSNNFFWHAMGDTGTNLKPNQKIATDGITTTSGLTTCTIVPPTTATQTLGVTPFTAVSIGGKEVSCVAASHGLIVTGNVSFNTTTTTNGITITANTRYRVTEVVDANTFKFMTYAPSSATALTAFGSTGLTLRKYGDEGDNRPGDIITISGASTGNGVDPNGSWHVIAANATLIIFETGQTASGTGGIGGASAIYTEPNISVGDVAVDVRGTRYTVTDCNWEGENWSRNVFRQREDSVGSPYSSFRNLKGKDLSPAWMNATDAHGRSFVSLLGQDGIAEGIQFESVNNNSYGVELGVTSTRSQVSDFSIKGCRVGLNIAGDQCKADSGTIFNPIERGVIVYGADDSRSQELDDDPITAVSVGSATVNVSAYQHGQVVGDVVNFESTIIGNGVTITRNVDITITAVPDENTFQIPVSTGTATSTSAFGGTAITVNYVNEEHTATSVQLENVTVYSTSANTAIGFSIGANEGNRGGAEDTSILLCRVSGIDTPYVDNGANTSWLVGNQGIPNNLVSDTLDVATLETISWGDPIHDWTWSENVTQMVFGNLGSYREVRVLFESATHDSGSNQQWFVRVSNDGGATFLDETGDYLGIGTVTSSRIFMTGNLAAATAASGTCTIYNMNQPQRSHVSTGGGQDSAGASAFDAEYCIRGPSAKFSITGGTSSPGVNEITDVTINGVSVLNTDVDWTTSNANTASLVATEINSSSSVYEAFSDGAVVTIYEIGPSGVSQDYEVAITVAGNVTVSTSSTTMNGTYDAIQFHASGGSITGGRVRIYGKQ